MCCLVSSSWGINFLIHCFLYPIFRAKRGKPVCIADVRSYQEARHMHYACIGFNLLVFTDMPYVIPIRAVCGVARVKNEYSANERIHFHVIKVHQIGFIYCPLFALGMFDADLSLHPQH